MVVHPDPLVRALDIKVYGLVQGVGFRPFIHRIAAEFGIAGWAVNRNDCVHIVAEGTADSLERFVSSIRTDPPPLAAVRDVVTEVVPVRGYTDFEIRTSVDFSTEVTRVSPDMAVCEDCLHDMRTQPNRIDYPFVNCTNCGPRFSIVEELPYDRARTTMNPFTMCPSCAAEYGDITDRRYHAQPNACADCGPSLELRVPGSAAVSGHTREILSRCADLLASGGILAMKGIGGYHLACAAEDEDAVRSLRERKLREGKPFAVMVCGIEAARELCAVGAAEEALLLSPRRPIVLLERRTDHGARAIARSVAGDLDTVGIMLPYTPFHHLLLDLTGPLVMTSGNRSDEPIAIADDEAGRMLAGTADAFLSYNREIRNREDDSVVMYAAGTLRFIRRSRGWVPEPVETAFETEGIVAAGAELKNCFAMGKGNQAILSQHIGDLKNPETYEFFEEAFDRLTTLFRVKPALLACDLHPDYLSSRFARGFGLPVIEVQHHYAHIASCMAETGIDEPVIGVSFDGTGYGDDGTVWGGEFFVCDLSGYERRAHLASVPLPGGDAAVKEPWRMAVSYLYRSMGDAFMGEDLPFLNAVPRRDLELLISMIDAGVNCVDTSSAGRLFDAAAAVLGIAPTATFEAEGPMRLQAMIDPSESGRYGYEAGESIDMGPCVTELADDVRRGVGLGTMAAKFHNTVVSVIVETAAAMARETGITKVMLSGGVFQNRFVLEESVRLLESGGLAPYSNAIVPANDGGICLGQLAVAAMRRSG